MSLELAGEIAENFEWRVLADGIEVTGSGRLRGLTVRFPGWLTPHAVEDAVGIDVEHEAGVVGRVRLRSGQRVRLEVSLEGEAQETVTVPGPVLTVEGAHSPVCWFAGASAEVVLPSEEGPGLLTQRRGIAVPTGEPASCHLLDTVVTLRPRQLATVAWTYEAFGGDLLDVPPEPSWLPLVRYTQEEPIEISAPDGLVTVGDGVDLEEEDGDFYLEPPLGLSTIGVWGAGGQSLVEVGWFVPLRDQLTVAVSDQPRDDVWCYLALAEMFEDTRIDEQRLDSIDALLGPYEDDPTAWSVCASHLATGLGLPLKEQTRRGAATVLARGQIDDVLLLGMSGLVSLPTVLGSWPVGDFNRVGMEAIAALHYGRVTSDERPERGRDVAVARLFAAGLGESERGLRANACIMSAEVRLLSRLSARPNAVDLAWLTLP